MSWKLFYIPALLVMTLASCREKVPAQTGTEEDTGPEAPLIRSLLPVGDLKLEEGAKEGSVLLTWEDNSTLEEGYLVRKAAAGGSEDFYIPANSSSWEDGNPALGAVQYTVMAYWHTERSAPVSVDYRRYQAPAVSVEKVSSSWYMLAVRLRLVSDGGQECTCGLEVTEEDTGKRLESVSVRAVRSGQTAWLLLENLRHGTGYLIRPYAVNGEAEVYGEAFKAALEPQPDPVELVWEDLPGVKPHAGLELKKSVTDAFGGQVNLWCAMADLREPSLQLRTTIAQSLMEPGEYIRQEMAKDNDVCVLVNGGYFASPRSSYSLVIDRGEKKASNISSLTRSKSYQVTRGFFGVDEKGRIQTGWQSSDGFYSRPLPVFDGGPALSVPKNHPAIEDWEPYSAIGGGPVLIKGGRYCFDYLQDEDGRYLSNHELFLPDIFAQGGRAPRTAIGGDAQGRVFLLVADGRGSGGSDGLTLDQLAAVMAGLGCTDVMNLDGGGSSMFLTGNEADLCNNPSDGRQRKILSFVSIVSSSQPQD